METTREEDRTGNGIRIFKRGMSHALVSALGASMNRSCAFETPLPTLTRRKLLGAATAAGLAITGGLGRQMSQVADANAASFPASLAATPLTDQLTWLLVAVNSGGTALTNAEIAEHVAPSLLASMPPAQIAALVQALAGGYGALTLQGMTRAQTATQAVALVSAAVGVQLALPITIEVDAPHRITGLTIYPSPSGDGAPLLPKLDGASASTDASLIDIGGRRLYRTDVGVGGPTVIFEAGLGDSAATWSGVVPAIAANTRVLSYDRANTTAGASDPAPTPRTAADAVADLHALLAAAGAPGPFVLVGHSVGGLFARLYAGTYPDEIAGLVLVDASHEEQDVRRQAMVSPELFAAEQQAINANPEGIELAASFSQMRESRATAPLHPMPLVVLSAGVADPGFFPADWPMDEETRLHDELQSDLAGLVPGGKLVIAPQSGHYIQQRRPDLVVAAIRDVVQAVLDPSTWGATAS